jgi:broad specificity phosphatase PhoE
MTSPSSQPTVLLVVRHAQTIWNHARRYAGHQEVPLSPDAEQQIRHLLHEVVGLPITAVYSSPLTRAQLTVRPVAEVLHVPLTVKDDLAERNLGSWEGKSAEELLASHPDFHYPDSAYDGHFSIPGAESLDSLEARTRAVFTEIAEAHLGQTVLVGTHAGLIWALERRVATNSEGTARWPDNSALAIFHYQNGVFEFVR